jgi:20S proteasome alpha/beta subunit
MLILARATVLDTQMAPELDQEERIQLIIKALRDGTIPSQRRAAFLYKIARTTL